MLSMPKTAPIKASIQIAEILDDALNFITYSLSCLLAWPYGPPAVTTTSWVWNDSPAAKSFTCAKSPAFLTQSNLDVNDELNLFYYVYHLINGVQYKRSAGAGLTVETAGEVGVAGRP